MKRPGHLKTTRKPLLPMIDQANCGCPEETKSVNNYSLFPQGNPSVKRFNNLVGASGCYKPSGGTPDQWKAYAQCLYPYNPTMNCYQIQAIIDACQGWIDQETRDIASGVSRSTAAGDKNIMTGFQMYQTDMKAAYTAAQCDAVVQNDTAQQQTQQTLAAAAGAQQISQSGQKPIMWILYAVLAIIAVVIAVKIFSKKKAAQ